MVAVMIRRLSEVKKVPTKKIALRRKLRWRAREDLNLHLLLH